MGSAKKLVGRGSPRYKFSDDDKRLMRFKGARGGRIHTTRLFDLSQSGISFMTASRLAPRIGDIIALEFAPMGSVQIACQGRVVRIEEPSKNATWSKFPDTVKVGVAFHDLPGAYRRVLVESLSAAFKRQDRDHRERILETSTILRKSTYSDGDRWLAENAWTFVAAAALLILVGIGIYLYNQMPQSEAPTTDAPWASGFFEKVVKPSK